MANYTAHYELIKPTSSEHVDVTKINTNSDNIDSIMYANEQRSTKGVGNTAPTYSTTETYSKGSYVTYDDELYICKTDGTTGAWDGSKWEQTSLGAHMADAESDISEIDVWVNVSAKTVTGNPITLTDASATIAQDLSVTLEPVQDLHGYDHPWAGGAGKNLYVGSPSFEGYTNISFWTLQDEKYNGHDVYKKSSACGGTANHFSVGEGTYTFSVMVKTRSNTNAFIYTIDNADAGKATVDVTSMQVSTNTSWTKVQCTFTVTSAGLIAPRIELGSDNDIYISEYQLEQGSTATPYEPYSNICPISGWDSVDIDRVNGKNLLDESKLSSGDLTYLPLNVGSGNFTLSSNAPLNAFNNANLFLFTGNVRDSISTITNGVWNAQSRTVTATNGYVTIASRNIGNVNPQDYHTMLESGTTATTYEPYQGKTYTIQLGGTRYGGTINATTSTCVMTVDRAIREFDGDEYWQAGSSVGTHYRMAYNMNDVVSTGQVNAISNELEYLNDYSQDSTHYYIYNGKLYVFLPASNETDFKAWLASNPLQIVYPIATPITIQLIPAELELLKGYNYITSNGATISLTYQPDSLLGDAMEYTDKRINDLSNVTVAISALGTDESGRTTASRAYTTGEYFYQDGRMYKVLTSISSGATFTVGTNCTQTTLFAELTAAQL